MHELFVVAALQGQSLFSAAGDSGAFDTVRDFGQGLGFTTPLSVDYPASDSAMTAAGGTTLPGPQMFSTPGGILTIDNPEERVWGWDYLEPLCNALGTPNFFQCGIFSVGSGGGVSSFFLIPVNQLGIAGTQLTRPGQASTETDVSPAMVLFKFPANFPGRNVPDVSFNADPQTGYVVDYTSSVTGLVGAPGGHKFRGAATERRQRAYSGPKPVIVWDCSTWSSTTCSVLASRLDRFPVIRTISTGDNWFYDGRNGYAPASGVGTIDVFKLSEVAPLRTAMSFKLKPSRHWRGQGATAESLRTPGRHCFIRHGSRSPPAASDQPIDGHFIEMISSS